MANRIKGITIEIDGNTTKLDKALQSTDNQLKKTQTSLKDVDRLLKMDPGNTELLAQKQRLLGDAVAGTKDRMETLKKAAEDADAALSRGNAYTAKYGDLEAQLAKVSDAYKDLAAKKKDMDTALSIGEISTEEYEKFNTQLQKTGEELKELRTRKKEADAEFAGAKIDQGQYDAIQRELIETAQTAEDMAEQLKQVNDALEGVGSGAEKAAETLQGVSARASAVSDAFAPVTKAVVSVGKSAIETTANFDKAMSQVAAISGATGDDLQALRDKAREMGETTKFSASEAADAMTYMAMAGWKTEDMLSGIEGIMNLAAASGESLSATSDIVTDALTAFGMSSEDSGRFADVLAAASSNANTNVGMMGETFKYVAPVAGALGYSAEDAALAIGLMANSGIKASQAGTALRSMLSRLAKPTKESGIAMHMLGVSLEDEEGNMYSFIEVMDQIRAGFEGGRITQDEYAKSVSELNELLEKEVITPKDYVNELEALDVALNGATGAQRGEIAAMLAGQEAMSGLLAIVSTSDEDYAKLTDAIYNSAGATEEMASIMQDNLPGQMEILNSQLEELYISFGEMLMPVIRDGVSLLQGLLDIFNGLPDGVKAVILVMAGLVAAISPVFGAISKISGGISSIITLSGQLSSGMGGALEAAKSLFFSPVGIAAGAAAAVVGLALLYENNEDVRNALAAFDSWITGVFTRDWTESFGAAGEVFNGFFAGVSDVYEGIKRVLGGIVDFVNGVFSGDWKRAWKGIVDIFGGVFDTLVAVVKAPINAVIGLINGFLKLITDGVNAVIGALNSFSVDVPEWVPVIGGKKFGFNFDALTPPSIPYLAQGGLAKRNNPFLAVVGDNPTQDEIISPYDKMVDAVREGLSGLSSVGGTQNITMTINGDLAALFRLFRIGIQTEDRRVGVSLERT